MFARFIASVAALLVFACGGSSNTDGSAGNDVVGDMGGSGSASGGSQGQGGSTTQRDASVPSQGGTMAQPDARTSTSPDSGELVVSNCGNGFFCDDFESFTAGEKPPAPWKLYFEPKPTHGTTLVDEKHAFSGKQSVHLTVSAAAGEKTTYLGLRGAPYFSPPRRLLYGRMMFWLNNLPNTNTHWSNIEARGSIAGKDPAISSSMHYGGQYGKLMAAWGTQGTPNPSDCALRAPNLTMPTKQWVCLEWRYDTAANEMRLWMNGKALTELTVMGKGQECVLDGTGGRWLLPDMNAISLGWANYQDMGTNEMWIDDVLLSTQSIGCPTSATAH